MVRRLIWTGLFTSLLCVVLFGLVVSPKATAITLTQEVVKDRVISLQNNVRCKINNQVINATEFGECLYSGSNQQTIQVQKIWNQVTDNFQKGDIVEFLIGVKQLQGNEDILWTVNTEHWLSPIGIEKVSNIANICNRFTLAPPMGGYAYYRGGCGNYSSLGTNENLDPWGHGWSSFYLITLELNKDAYGVNIGIGHLDAGSTIFINSLVDQNIWMSDINVYKRVESTTEYFEQNKQEDQQQGTQSNTDSGQAGQDVEGATTNLLSAITGFFGAFTSASATTCQTDWGIEGFRNFDFCGTQIPTALRVVFTIVASVIFIPMIWFLINSILNAFKEFQQ